MEGRQTSFSFAWFLKLSAWDLNVMAAVISVISAYQITLRLELRSKDNKSWKIAVWMPCVPPDLTGETETSLLFKLLCIS